MKSNLQNKLERIKSVIPKGEWKYFHIESIENFIFHLPSIKSDRTRARIENEIDLYLVSVEEQFASKKNLTDIYKELYSKKLYSIVTFYEDELKFVKKPYYFLTIIFLTILFIGLFKILNVYWAIILVGLVTVTYMFYIRSKIRSKKFY